MDWVLDLEQHFDFINLILTWFHPEVQVNHLTSALHLYNDATDYLVYILSLSLIPVCSIQEKTQCSFVPAIFSYII